MNVRLPNPRMSMATETILLSSPGSTSDSLSALSPDLPLLAARAAIELDNLIRQRHSNLENVQLLASRLTNSIEPSSQSDRRFTSDPATLDIVARALGAS